MHCQVLLAGGAPLFLWAIKGSCGLALRKMSDAGEIRARLKAALDLADGGQRARAEYLSAIAALGPSAGPLVASGQQWEVMLKDGRAMQVRAPRYLPLSAAQTDAEAALRDALAQAGVKEHRALATGDAKDVAEYTAALARVDEASARVWELCAAGSAARWALPQERAAQLAKEAQEAAKSGDRVRAAALRQRAGGAARPPSDGAIALLIEPPAVSYEAGAKVVRRVAQRARDERITRMIKGKKAPPPGPG